MSQQFSHWEASESKAKVEKPKDPAPTVRDWVSAPAVVPKKGIPEKEVDIYANAVCHDLCSSDLYCFHFMILQEHSGRPTSHHRGPLIGQPTPLPASATEPKHKPSCETKLLAEHQSKMRKTKRDEEKAAVAAKEADKVAKAAAKAAKNQEKETKKQQKEALKADKAKQKDKHVETTGSSHSKAPEAKLPRKRKIAEPTQEPGHAKLDSPNVAKRGLARVTETPCKIRDPTGKVATPAKIKQRRKREEKAAQALLKLRRQKELLADLKDLPLPQDESKLTLDCIYECAVPCLVQSIKISFLDHDGIDVVTNYHVWT